jgi:uncharacterized membrane protein
MTLFIIGLIVFFGVHAVPTLARGWRDALIAKLGEGPYKGLYALASLAGFTLIIIGWRSADASQLYVTPAYFRHITYALMLIALILLVAAYVPAGRIAAAVKHPMLAAVKIWAFAHLLANGEVRSVLLFGAFLIFAVAARISAKKRAAPIRAAGPWRNDGVAIIVGVAAYAGIAAYLHQYIAGVALV